MSHKAQIYKLIQNLNLNVCLASIWFRCSEFVLDTHNTDLHWHSGHELGDARVGVGVELGVRGACMYCSYNGLWKGQQLQGAVCILKQPLTLNTSSLFSPGTSTGRTKACLGQNLLENCELVKQYLLIGNITSHGRLREKQVKILWNRLMWSWEVGSARKLGRVPLHVICVKHRDDWNKEKLDRYVARIGEKKILTDSFGDKSGPL